MRTFPWALALSLIATAAFAGSPSISEPSTPDKDQYNLFNPAPDNLLRDIPSSTFDKVADPFTVDAGHFEINGLMDYYYNARTLYNVQNLPGNWYQKDYQNAYMNHFEWAPSVTVGLLNNVDFSIGASYSTIKNSGSVSYSDLFYDPYYGFSSYSNSYKYSSTRNEWGSVDLASTINLWGNDGGLTALGLIPALSVPTNGGDVLGGVAIPFAVRLPQEVMLKLATAVSADEIGGGLYAEFSNSLAVEKTFCKHTTVFANLETYVTTDSAQAWYGYTGFGAAYKFTNNFQVYAAMRFGIGNGDDYAPYIGATWRY